MIRFPCLAVAVAALFLTSGGNAAEPTDAERLAASAAKWKKAKEAAGGNYHYKAIRSSFTGFRSETVVVVKAGVVTERRHVATDGGKPGEPGPLKEVWVETGKDIGTHKDGVAARTLEELYAEAKKVLDAPLPANHVRSLGFDKQGILAYCYTRDTRIADDAPLGGVAPIYLEMGKK